MRIATWNVNSVRARAERIGAWLDRSDVDVLAIQELKCKEEQFPYDLFTERGYEVTMSGFNQWNGVAIASRIGLEGSSPLADMPTFGDAEYPEARDLSARCGGVHVFSLYVPNGRELGHPHYEYKMAWLEQLKNTAEAILTENPEAQVVLCGDFNIAPHDEDVWDMEVFAGATHVSAREREAFQALLNVGFSDAARPYTPGPGIYTYWDYQQLRFPKRQGMRIDFQLTSPALTTQVCNAWVDREERKGKGASDHAPVVVEYTD